MDDMCEKRFNEYQAVDGKPGEIVFEAGSSSKLGNNNQVSRKEAA